MIHSSHFQAKIFVTEKLSLKQGYLCDVLCECNLERCRSKLMRKRHAFQFMDTHFF